MRAPFGRSQGKPEHSAATTTQGSHTPLQNFCLISNYYYYSMRTAPILLFLKITHISKQSFNKLFFCYCAWVTQGPSPSKPSLCPALIQKVTCARSRSLLFSGGNHGQAAGRRPSRRGIDLMPNGGMAPPELLSRNPNSKSAALGLRRG